MPLNHLNVGRLAHGGEIHARIGDHALTALDGEAQQMREVGTLVKPVRVAPQQFETLWVSGVTRLDEAMHQPGAGVSAALRKKDGLLGVCHDVTVGLAALGNAFHDGVKTLAEFGVIDPAQGVPRRHQEAPGVGPGKVFLPKLYPPSPARRFYRGLGRAHSLAELAKQVINRIGIQKIKNIVFHGLLENATR
jgi:hypothetical protein